LKIGLVLTKLWILKVS